MAARDEGERARHSGSPAIHASNTDPPATAISGVTSPRMTAISSGAPAPDPGARPGLHDGLGSPPKPVEPAYRRLRLPWKHWHRTRRKNLSKVIAVGDHNMKCESGIVDR
jgi:hypothetical protein